MTSADADPAFEEWLSRSLTWSEAKADYDELFINELHAHLSAAFPGRVQYATKGLRDDPCSTSVHLTASDAASMDDLPSKVASALEEDARRQVADAGFDRAAPDWSIHFEHSVVGVRHDGGIDALGVHASATVLVVAEAVDPGHF